MKIRPIGAELLQTDGRQDKTKQTVAFRDFTQAPKNKTVHDKSAHIYCIPSRRSEHIDAGVSLRAEIMEQFSTQHDADCTG